MILDTSFVIDFFRSRKDALEKAEILTKREEPLFLTAVTVFEIWQNFDLRNKQKCDALASFIQSFGLFPMNIECAEIGGKIRSELALKGIIIEPEDCMIAGIALNHHQSILTKNIKHFQRISGLKVEGY